MWKTLLSFAAAALAVVGLAVGRGAAEAVLDRGMMLLPSYAREQQWEVCRGSQDPEEGTQACLARANDPQEPAVNRALAFVRIGNGTLEDDPAAAITQFDRAIALDPTSHRAFTAKAAALLAYGQVDAASDNLDRAIALRPDYIGARYYRAIVWFQRGDYRGAAERLSDMISDLPAAEARLNAQRIDDLTHNRTYDPFDLHIDNADTAAQLQIWRAAALFAAGDRQAADEAHHTAVALDPEIDVDLAHSCERYAFRSVNWVATRALCSAMIAYEPQQQAHRIARGLSALRAGDNAAAIADFQIVLTATRDAGAAINISTEAGRAAALQQALEAGYRGQALYGRGIARRRMHDARADADLALASTEQPDVAQYFANAQVH